MSFNIPLTFPLGSGVDVEAVKQTLNLIGQRHESFRTYFAEVGGEPVQVIAPSVEIPFSVIDLSDQEAGEVGKQRIEIMARERRTSFDLSRAPLFRALLIKLPGDKWEFICCMHHIISDGWSQEILTRDFNRFYSALTSGEPVEAGVLPLQYRDFSIWNARRVSDQGLQQEAHQFWKEKVEKGIPECILPYDYSGGETNLAGAGYRTFASGQVKDGLNVLAAENDTTPFILLFSVYNWLLARFAGTGTILSSVISAGREHSKLQDIVGCFINSVIVKTDVDLEEDFEEFVRRTGDDVTRVLQYQEYPLEFVLDDLGQTYPEVPVSFNMLNMQDRSTGSSLEHLEPVHIDNMGDVKFNLALHATEYQNGLELQWVYKKGRFKPQTMEFIAHGFLDLLEAITASEEE